jgi:hypothetical protein
VSQVTPALLRFMDEILSWAKIVMLKLGDMGLTCERQ